MNKSKSLLKTVVKALWYFYIILGPAIPIFYSEIIVEKPLLGYVLTPAWVALVSKLLYDNSDRVYFWVTRSWMWFSNTEVDWSLSVELAGKSDRETLDKVLNGILATYPNSKTWHNDEIKKIVELPFGCNIQFSQSNYHDGLGEKNVSFYLRISELIVPFRRSEDVLDTLIALIDDKIIPIVKPEKEKYAFKVKFGGVNPYFGLFVRRLRIPDQSLVAFRVEFDENVGHKKERVEVSDKRVTLSVQSLASLQMLSKRYITLASIDLTNSS